MAQDLLLNPLIVLPLFDQGLLEAQSSIFAQSSASKQEKLLIKPRCHIRISRLPLDKDCFKHTISGIRCQDTKRLISICGTVVRTGAIKMLETSREYQCNQCGHRFIVKSQIEQDSRFELPNICPSSKSNGRINGLHRCKSRSISYVEGSKICGDYQEIRIQERVQNLDMGSVPRCLKAILQNDLVDTIQAGSDVILTGTLTYNWSTGPRRESACLLDLYMDVNHVQYDREMARADEFYISDEQILEFQEFWKLHSNQETLLTGRDSIIKAFCPQIYGMYLVKLSVLLCIIGGVSIPIQGSHIRGQPHILLVGSPGCGKSQILKYAASLVERSVLTTGVGSTSAGLTVTAVKESGSDWALEAGALVLADGGICCIDEFGSIRNSDRNAVHEAMEQQSISVAKAGLVCSLKTRCSVIAAMNPKGEYDPNAELAVNCAIASPLLSRFDIILLLLDRKNESWDRAVCSHILGESSRTSIKSKQDGQPEWKFETLKAYIQLVRSKINPTMSNVSKTILSRYYQLQRKSESRSAARTTIRLLESLVRIAQAHARLMFRDRVLPVDAIMTILIVESSMESSTIFNQGISPHAEFPKEPESELCRLKEIILKKLDMGEILYEEEDFDYTQMLTGIVLDGSTNTQTSSALARDDNDLPLESDAQLEGSLYSIEETHKESTEKSNCLDLHSRRSGISLEVSSASGENKSVDEENLETIELFEDLEEDVQFILEAEASALLPREHAENQEILNTCKGDNFEEFMDLDFEVDDEIIQSLTSQVESSRGSLLLNKRTPHFL